MLARLHGTLSELASSPPSAVIVPEGMPGIGYEVLLPAYLSERLSTAGAGGSVDLYTIQYLEGVNQGVSFTPRLIGFASAEERGFFELLTSVKGLGNKRALRAMVVPPSSIARAIADRDSRYLQRLPEIGPKLAELIVHELKNKVSGYINTGGGLDAPEAAPVDAPGAAKGRGKAKGATASSPVGELKPAKAKRAGTDQPVAGAGESRPPIREAIEALVALGESPIDAERMVMRAIERSRSAGGAALDTTPALLSAAFAARQ